MKTFDEEKWELFDELRKRTEQYYEEQEQEAKERGGLGRDSMANYRYQQDRHKINKKFLELKIKYDIPLTDSEQDYYKRLKRLFKE